MRLKVACAQLAPHKAEIAKNLDRIAETILQAATEKVGLVCFSEASTTGYFLEGGVVELSLTQEQLVAELTGRLTSHIGAIDVSVGFYLNSGGNLYNAAAYLSVTNGLPKLIHLHRKIFLPTYGVFDEERFVARGRDLETFEVHGATFSTLICEDVWHSILPTIAAARGAQAILVPAASPARGFGGKEIQNHERYRRLFRAISEEHGVYCINTQLTGFEGGKGFIGGSMIIDPFGSVVVEAPVGQECLITAELDLSLVAIARAQTPLISDLQAAWGDIKRMVAETD